MSVMQPLRDEHQRLWPEVERLRALAERLGERDPQEFDHELTAVRQFLRDHLIPHLRAEEAVLYPAVAAAMGSPAATATMSRDHLEMDRLAQELGKLHQHLDADPAGLQRVLYGLYALLAVHLAKEDEIYLPLLEQVLSAEEADRLLSDMAQVEHAPGAEQRRPGAEQGRPGAEQGRPAQA